MYDAIKNAERGEIDPTHTIFIRDIETRVIQGIVLQVLSKIENISLLEGNIFDSLLGRDLERIKGIYVEMEPKAKAVNIRVEINVIYGISIPEKSEEIQGKLVDEITRWTGLHVSSVHIVFKHLISQRQEAEITEEAVTFEGSYQ